MLSQSCLLVVGVLAVLSSLIWLASRLESACSVGYQPRALTQQEVSGVEGYEGMEPVVRALCLLAASIHAEPGNEDSAQKQQDIAKCYFQWCLEGDPPVELDDALINSVGKTVRFNRGRSRRDEPKRG